MIFDQRPSSARKDDLCSIDVTAVTQKAENRDQLLGDPIKYCCSLAVSRCVKLPAALVLPQCWALLRRGPA